MIIFFKICLGEGVASKGQLFGGIHRVLSKETSLDQSKNETDYFFLGRRIDFI
jgi:hypothetical protein